MVTIKQLENYRDLLRTDSCMQGLELALNEIMITQSIVSSPVPNAIPAYGDMPSKDAIRTYVLAMAVELMEFLQTLDWKPWKNKQVDADRVVDEFADIIAFQGIIVYYLSLYGITPAMLAKGYAEKSAVNIERFLGLHGVEYKQASLLGMDGNNDISA